MADVVEVDPAECDVTPVLARVDLGAAQRGAVGLVGPAEEREESLDAVLEAGILEGARALEMFEAFLERLVEADHHRRGRAQHRLDDRPLRGADTRRRCT